MRTLSLAGVLTLLACASPVAAADPAKPPAPAPDYQQHVVPIFTKYCTGCHDAETAEGKFVLDSYPALVKGGPKGAVLAPGDSARSRLIRLITGEAEPKMPPKDEKAPTPAEVAVLKAWIDAGAKGPSGAALDPTQLVTPSIPPRKTLKKSVHAVEFAPQEKLLAIGRYRTVQLVTVPEGSIVRELRDLPGDVTSVRFSKDGAWLITAAGEPGLFGEAAIWKKADGALVKKFRGHKDSLYAAELSPDGKTLATAGYDKLILLWDTGSGEIRHTLKGHNDAVYGLAFSPNGKWLASASGDRTAKLWDVATGARLETFPQSLKELYSVAFHPNGKQLVAAGVDNRIRVWQLSETGKEGSNPILHSRYAHEGPILRVVFSADGKQLVSTAEDRTVKFWDPGPYAERLVVEKQPDWAAALAFAPDAKTLAVGRHDGTLALYDPATGAKQKDLTPALPKPELTGLEPAAVQTGQPMKLKLVGKHLAGITEVKTGHGKIAAKLEGQTVEITASPEVPRGVYDLSVVTPAGTSAAVKLYVDDLPQFSEVEPNDAQDKAQLVTTPASVWGVLSKQGDEDHIAFEAAAGETLVIDVSANLLGSKANALLTVFDSTGRVLAASNDFDGQSDPLTAVTIPAAGRYTLRIRDLLLAGSAEHKYRVSIGKFPFVAGAYPLSMAPNAELDVTLAGFNLPAGAKARIRSGGMGEVVVPLDPRQYRFRKQPVLLVGKFAEQLEMEPNDAPSQATPLNVPGTIGGRFVSAGQPAGSAASIAATADTGAKTDVDYFRFHAKAGQSWIIETEAARRGSPVDTKVEVLTTDGKPIERLLLQATRDSYVTFRGIDSRSADCRVKNWEEMELNQFLYLQGEICKIFRMPQGPDSGFNFYQVAGKRRCYFDTSATTHALDEPCYIVEPHQPGAKLQPNGLPVFPLYYVNDDSGDRKLGTDSRLTFQAPADGDYLVRVVETRDRTGDRFGYRLTVRPPAPDFSVNLSGNGNIGASSGERFTLNADRVDGFDDDIRVEISGLPPGFSTASPVVIEAGHMAGQFVVHAAADAKAPTPEQLKGIKVTATAVIGGVPVTRPVSGLTTLSVRPKPKVVVRLEPAEITIAPGEVVAATLKVDRTGGFNDRIQFDVENLPHGVIVDNIGLSGVLIRENESERQIFLAARKWVEEMDRPFFAVAKVEGNQASPPVTLKVRKKAK